MRIIHFSDFHLSKSAVGNSKALMDRMLKALAEVNKESKIDLVVFSGDLINLGGEGEPISDVFKLFTSEVIERFEKELDVPQNRFFFVAGNHDMYRNADTKEEDRALDKKMDSVPSVENITRSEETYGLKRTLPYNEYEKSFYSTQVGGKDQLEYVDTLFQSNIKLNVNGLRVGISLLNSSWHSYNSKIDRHRVVIGRSQVVDSKAFLSDCDIKFAVSHYDTSWLKGFDHDDIIPLLTQQYDIVFTGHTHSSAMRGDVEPEGSVFYITAPGTLCANLDKGDTPYANAFLVLDYDHTFKNIRAVKYKQNNFEDFVFDTSFADGGIFERSIADYSNFVSLKQEFKRMFKGMPYIDSPCLQSISKELLDDNNKTLQLVALSGLGKTRLVVEAFRGKDIPHSYYCEYKENNDSSIFKEFEKILDSHENDTGLVIIDNCPNSVLSKMISKRDNYSSRFRIIGINNMYFDRETMPKCKQLTFSHSDLEKDVNEFIDKHVPIENNDDFIARQIKIISGGFPSVAIDLIDEYKKGGRLGVDSVEALIPKLLQLDGLPEERRNNYLMTLSTMALFQPMPYGREEVRQFILSEDSITPLWGMDYQQRSSLFAHTISRYKGTFIEISQTWLNIRPLPLAIWLVKQWFKDCENNPERLNRLFSSFRDLPEPPQKLVLECMAKRLEYMQGNTQAEDLFEELVDINGGPFGNEKVVCSEMGSRLFLSMATVNPSAVANCLGNIFLHKKIDWIRDNVRGDTRRNLIWALEKLCFAHESFGDAIQVMAKFALAENEKYANNATGQLSQLFHIVLAGTQATLAERVSVIKSFKSKGQEYKKLTLGVLKAAMQNDHFMRDGGAEKFGFDRREEFQPNNQQIIAYWFECRDIVLQWLKEDNSIWEEVSDIISSYYFRWCANGFAKQLFFPLLECVYSVHSNGNDKLYYDLIRSDNYVKRRLRDDEKEELVSWEKKLMPTSFVTKLRSERLDSDIDYKLPLEERRKVLESRFLPLVEEFLGRELYASKETLLEIIDDQEYFDSQFSYFLIKKSSDVQLEQLFDVLVQIAVERRINIKRGFYSNLFYHARENVVFEKSLKEILASGLQVQYVALLTLSETEDLKVLNRLKIEASNGVCTIDFIPIYLVRLSLWTEKMFVDILSSLEPDYPSKANVIMDFVLSHRFGLVKDNLAEILPYVKKLILCFDVDSANQNDAFEYSRFVAEFLKNVKDHFFVTSLNNKLIALYQKGNLHLKLRDTYSSLIKYHSEVIWEDFVKAFVDPDNPSFYLQVESELGSGSGFGRGPLFEIDDEKVKKMCMDYPDEAPHRVAQMIPLFHYNNDKAVDRFSDWFLWLIDNFADRKYVLSGLHGNLNTFSWTGSTIPYYDRNIYCFKLLLNHSNPNVVEWAQQNIEQNENEMKREIDKEEYIRLHYN